MGIRVLRGKSSPGLVPVFILQALRHLATVWSVAENT